MTASVITIVVAICLSILWMFMLEFRLARVLTNAEATNDQADRALGFITDHAGWIADHAAPAVERIAALAPEIADALITHRSVLAGLPRWMHGDFPDPGPQTEPDIPAQPRRPQPGPATVPEQHAITNGHRAAEDVANGRVEDVEFAHDLAAIEDQIWQWRHSMEASR